MITLVNAKNFKKLQVQIVKINLLPVQIVFFTCFLSSEHAFGHYFKEALNILINIMTFLSNPIKCGLIAYLIQKIDIINSLVISGQLKSLTTILLNKSYELSMKHDMQYSEKALVYSLDAAFIIGDQ